MVFRSSKCVQVGGFKRCEIKCPGCTSNRSFVVNDRLKKFGFRNTQSRGLNMKFNTYHMDCTVFVMCLYHVSCSISFFFKTLFARASNRTKQSLHAISVQALFCMIGGPCKSPKNQILIWSTESLKAEKTIGKIFFMIIENF